MVNPSFLGLARKAGLKNAWVATKNQGYQLTDDWFHLGYHDAKLLVYEIDGLLSSFIPEIKGGFWFYSPLRRLAQQLRWNAFYWDLIADIFADKNTIICLYDQPVLQSNHSYIPGRHIT